MPEIEDLGPAQIEDLGPAALSGLPEEVGPVDKSLRNAPSWQRKIIAGGMSRFQEQAAENKSSILGEQQAPGSMIGRVADKIFGDVGKPIVEGAKDLLTGAEPGAGGLSEAWRGVKGVGKLAMEVGGLPFTAPASAAGAAIQEAEIARGTPYAQAQGMGDVGQAGVDVGSLAVFGAQGIKGLMPKRALVTDVETGAQVMKNPPADEALQAEHLKTMEAKGANDPQKIAEHISEREGVPAPVVEVKPEAQISKTEALPDGNIKVTIEPGTPGEISTRLEHEVGSHVPEKLGLKGAPVEDNNLLVQEGLAKEAASVPLVSLPVPPEIAESLLKEGISRHVVEQAGQLFANGTITRDSSKLISDQVMEAVTSGKVDLGPLQALLDKSGIGLVEFGEGMLRVKAGDAGRTLQQYSALQSELNKIASDNIPELARLVDKQGGPWARLYWRYGAIRDVWRGLLTSQVSTSIRNIISQGATFGLDAFEKTISSGIQKAMGKNATSAFEATNKLSPLDGMEEFFSLVHGGKNKRLADQLIKQVDYVDDALFTSYNSDVSTKIGTATNAIDKGLLQAKKAVGHINWINQGQEFMFRRANLVASLDTKLSKVGLSLEKLVQNKMAGEYFADGIGKKIMGDVIEETLTKTYAASPAHGTVMAKMISVINAVPGASLVVPFPRFIYNSSKFFFQHSPFGLVKLLSPAERAAIAAGDVKTYSKAITGSLMFGAAYAFRKSEFAGEKAWEAKGPGGTTIDLRPFAPFLAYPILADYLVRYEENRLNDVDLQELAAAALSANVRAGTGLYVLDQIGRLVSSRSNPDKLGTSLKRMAGEFVGGFLTPVNTIRDAMAGYDDYLQVQRDTSSEPFLGPIKAHLPTHSGLPEKFSPTQSEPRRDVSPPFKQATGLRLIEQKNPVQKEMDRLGISEYESNPSSGSPEFDQIVARHMGPLVEDNLTYFVQSPEFSQMDNIQKLAALKRALRKLHAKAIRMAKSENPESYRGVKDARRPWYDKALVESHPSDVDPEAAIDPEAP